jgi:hypothetical protein
MTRSQRLHRGLLTLGLPLCLGSGPLLAQDDEPFDRTPQDCLVTSSIDRTHVLDDQTILFYMRNDRVFRNYLPRKCPGLARQDRFMYETRGSRLCSIDTITVLEQWGGRLEPGFTCRLGDFHPVSPEEVEDIELSEEDRPGRDPIEANPVELPVEAAVEAETAPSPGAAAEE